MTPDWPGWLRALMFGTWLTAVPQSAATTLLALAALLFVGVARQDYLAGAHPFTVIT